MIQSPDCGQRVSSCDHQALTWRWPVFFFVFAVILAKNLGQGTFQQNEEFILIAKEERGQTLPKQIGWPFPFLSTEAYTLNPIWENWAGKPLTPQQVAIYAFVDCVISISTLLAVTNCLSKVMHSCNWRFSCRALLAAISLLATVLAVEREFFSHRNGVGAFSSAISRCVDALMLVFLGVTYYWLMGAIGKLFSIIRSRILSYFASRNR